MRNLVWVILLLPFLLQAQIKFEKGYVILNSGERVDCEIRNEDWQNNPDEVKYRLNASDEIKRASVEEIKEFGVNRKSRFVKAEVFIDRSSTDLSRLSVFKEPVHEQEVLFLRVLVEGEANLYVYRDTNLSKYYYNIGDQPVEVLVHRLYLIKDDRIAHNNQYKQQLLNSLKCQTLTNRDFFNLKYEKNSLIRIFRQYNGCGEEVPKEKVKEYKKETASRFQFKVLAGAMGSRLSLESSSTGYYRDMVFTNEVNFSGGLEAELILPFNKSKWSLVGNVLYGSYKSEKAVYSQTSSNPRWISVDYQMIDVPLGLRHYFFVGNDSKIFLNAFFVSSFPVGKDPSVKFLYQRDLDIMVSHCLSLGGGVNWNRFSLEARYNTRRDIMSNTVLIASKFDSFHVLFGYRFL